MIVDDALHAEVVDAEPRRTVGVFQTGDARPPRRIASGAAAVPVPQAFDADLRVLGADETVAIRALHTSYAATFDQITDLVTRTVEICVALCADKEVWAAELFGRTVAGGQAAHALFLDGVAVLIRAIVVVQAFDTFVSTVTEARWAVAVVETGRAPAGGPIAHTVWCAVAIVSTLDTGATLEIAVQGTLVVSRALDVVAVSLGSSLSAGIRPARICPRPNLGAPVRPTRVRLGSRIRIGVPGPHVHLRPGLEPSVDTALEPFACQVVDDVL